MPKSAVSKGMPDSLRSKIAASQAGTSPSLIPPGIGGTPALPARQNEKEKSPALEELMEAGEDRTTLQNLVNRYHIVNGVKKAQVKELKILSPRIKNILGSYGINQFTYTGIAVNYFPTERRKINKNKLLAAGVSLEVIEACTDVKPGGSLVVGDDYSEEDDDE